MLMGINILPIIKYTVAVMILVCIVLAPAYLAAINERDKLDKMRVRCGVLLFGWSVVGWMYALFRAARK